MTRPGYRSSIVRPNRAQAPAEVLNVDYKDVMEQAIRNERAAVLRKIRNAVEGVKTSKDRDSYSYHSDPRSPDEVKRDVLAILTRMED